MKECRRCHVEKQPSEFYANKANKDGLGPYCKLCKSAINKSMDREKERQRAKAYYYKDHLATVERQRAKREREHEAGIKRGSNWRRYKNNPKDPIKVAARRTVEDAVRRGVITKPSICSECKANKPRKLIHAHHSDYAKPLSVVWLCSRCHGKQHRRVQVSHSAQTGATA